MGVTGDYILLRVVKCGQRWLGVVTCGYRWLQVVTCGYG